MKNDDLRSVSNYGITDKRVEIRSWLGGLEICNLNSYNLIRYRRKIMHLDCGETVLLNDVSHDEDGEMTDNKM